MSRPISEPLRTYDHWSIDWQSAWAAIGWLASTDIMQRELVLAISSIANNSAAAIRELQERSDNFKISLDWAIKTARARMR